MDSLKRKAPRSAALFDTDAFYRESCESGFVKLQDIARNVVWTTPTKWGDLEITVNLSKPEKDPRAIAAAARSSAESVHVDPATGAIRSCPLCVTQADVACGYARRVPVGGEPWALWYSPYAYYDEHCIAMSWQHRPMHIDRKAFEGLFSLVDSFPSYFFGSNADLPIVGGSILAHDHFQGGRHVFPMQKADLAQPLNMPSFPGVKADILKWPLSVIRLRGARSADIVDAASAILACWRDYDDESVGIVSKTVEQSADGPIVVRHNTITPIAWVSEGTYFLDLALRCNITSDEHPLGVFHPHEELHRIKRENIGLIEVMGLAILPPRVRDVMACEGLSRKEVGCLFARVLEDAGVFKWDDAGRAAFCRFARALR